MEVMASSFALRSPAASDNAFVFYQGPPQRKRQKKRRVPEMADDGSFVDIDDILARFEEQSPQTGFPSNAQGLPALILPTQARSPPSRLTRSPQDDEGISGSVRRGARPGVDDFSEFDEAPSSSTEACQEQRPIESVESLLDQDMLIAVPDEPDVILVDSSSDDDGTAAPQNGRPTAIDLSLDSDVPSLPLDTAPEPTPQNGGLQASVSTKHSKSGDRETNSPQETESPDAFPPLLQDASHSSHLKNDSIALDTPPVHAPSSPTTRTDGWSALLEDDRNGASQPLGIASEPACRNAGLEADRPMHDMRGGEHASNPWRSIEGPEALSSPSHDPIDRAPSANNGRTLEMPAVNTSGSLSPERVAAGSEDDDVPVVPQRRRRLCRKRPRGIMPSPRPSRSSNHSISPSPSPGRSPTPSPSYIPSPMRSPNLNPAVRPFSAPSRDSQAGSDTEALPLHRGKRQTQHNAYGKRQHSQDASCNQRFAVTAPSIIRQWQAGAVVVQCTTGSDGKSTFSVCATGEGKLTFEAPQPGQIGGQHPTIQRNRYTKEDDRLILKLREEKGLPWNEIADYFPSRTTASLQVRYSSHLNRERLKRQRLKRTRKGI